MQLGMHGQQTAQQRRKDPLDPQPEQHSDQAASQAEQHRLEHVNAQDVGGSRSDRLHDSEHLYALLQMRAHRHGYADGAQDHGNQADQAKQSGRAIQALRQRRIALAKVHDLRVREHLLKLRADLCDVPTLRRQFE